MAAMVASKNSTELGTREMILGILKTKDKTHRNIIHSSDFRTTLEDLGFSMGSSIVEDLLIYCKLDNDGYLDFSELERNLIRERKMANASAANRTIAPPSSAGSTVKPWRADEAHRSKIDAEKQSMRISEHNEEVHAIYSALSFHEISSQDALQALAKLDIQYTAPFVKILEEMEMNEVPYSDFIRSLTICSSDRGNLAAQDVAAGGFRRKPEDCGENLGMHRKRATGLAVHYESVQNEAVQRRLKKPVDPSRPNGHATHRDQRIFKSCAVKDILQESIRTVDEGRVVPLLSHAQQDMAIGKLGKVVDGVDKVKYNIERKLKREQLDSGELTMSDFQDVLFSIGIDLPEALHAQLNRAVIAGNIDLRHFTKMMDAALFKAQALEDVIHMPAITELIQRFRKIIFRHSNANRKSSSLFIKLTEIFHNMDADEDGQLTFQEFQSACTNMLQGLSKEDVRLLFHSFDPDGNGSISLTAFLDQLTSSKEDGDHEAIAFYNSQRADIVRQAFQEVIRSKRTAQLSVEDIIESMDWPEHPAVVLDGSVPPITVKECVHDMLQFFDYHSKILSETVSWEEENNGKTDVDFLVFDKYFRLLSANISVGKLPSDDPFIVAMRKCFHLTPGKQPAPPMLTVRRGPAAMKLGSGVSSEDIQSVAPRALQNHGDCISWRQTEDGVLESEEKQQQEGRKIFSGALSRENHTDVILWKKRQDNHNSPKEAVVEEMRAAGIGKIAASPRKNVSSATKQLMVWRSDPKSVNQPVSFTTSDVFLPFQDEVPPAGRPVLFNADISKSNDSDVYGRKLCSKALEEFYFRPKPFGTDADCGNSLRSARKPQHFASPGGLQSPQKQTLSDHNKSVSESQVLSLREALLGSKGRHPKSLASYL
eukprot:gene409-442_t